MVRIKFSRFHFNTSSRSVPIGNVTDTAVAAVVVVAVELQPRAAEVLRRLLVRFAFERKLPRLLQLSLQLLLLRLQLLLQRDDALEVGLVLRRHLRHSLGGVEVAAARRARHLVVELLGDAVLDAVVLGDDPLVVVLVEAALKGAAVPGLAT